MKNENNGNFIIKRKIGVGVLRAGVLRAGVLRGGLMAFALVGLLSAGSASASMVTPTPAASRGSARLDAVSCLSSKWCLAVGTVTTVAHGQQALAEVWANGKWTVLPPAPVPGLTSVSCSSQTFCLTDVAENEVVSVTSRWNGKTWTTNRGPKEQASPLRCADSKLCTIISKPGVKDTGPVVDVWSGKDWLPDLQTSVCLDFSDCGLRDVSCGSKVNCVAVGHTTFSGGIREETAIYDGKNWRIATIPTTRPSDGDPIALASADSCAGTYCLALGVAQIKVDGGNQAAIDVYNATTGKWTNKAESRPLAGKCGDDCFPPGSLSCGSPVNCMEFSSTLGALAWNGTKLSPARPVAVGHGSSLGPASCGTTYCLAVGFRTENGAVKTLAELWNGKSWKVLTMPNVG